MDEITELKRIWESTEKRLSALSGTSSDDEEIDNDDEEIESFDSFMDDILDIERTQYLSSGNWETKEYTIVIGTGGPHVEFTTNYQINVYWGGKSQEFTTYDDNARSTIDRVCEYLDETSNY